MEGEALQYKRGKTVTPESPRPLHIVVPSNIPVLENQTDQIFNLMSTHLQPPYAARDLTAMDHEHPATTPEVHYGQGHGGPTNTQELEDTETSLGNVYDTEPTQSNSSFNEHNVSTVIDQPSASFEMHPNSSSINTSNLPSIPTTLPSTTDAPQNIATNGPSQAHITTESGSTGNIHYNPNDPPNQAAADHDGVANGDVNYQALFDTLVPVNEVEPSTTTDNPESSASATNASEVPAPNTNNLPSTSFSPAAGLPPRPPPQDKPAIHPNYTPGEDIRNYHFPHIHNANAQATQSNNTYRSPQTFAATGIPQVGSNGLPAPPLASFQQPVTSQGQTDRADLQAARRQSLLNNSGVHKGDNAYDADLREKYETFLNDESVFTAEGAWDKFPQGSRLFVGNLPTELVSKRDIFDIFHCYGRLAQISIKQAYGFVQFMDTEACMTALREEQGGKLKDRNMHLEVSKPPKNTRNAAGSAAGNNLRAGHIRRSPSPDRRPGSRSQRNGRNPPFSDFRDEQPRRVRDDYRPGRSPSPRGGRGRDEYRGGRDRSPDRYYNGRRRSRSPYGRGHNRSPSPRRRSQDDEGDELRMLPRRGLGEVPDVQIIMVDDMDRQFIQYLQKTFNNRGLRCDYLLLPRVSLAAVVKRQIVEGVQAVVKLYRQSQVNGKIPLQVFDRSAGADNVRFEEYNDLDAHIAAELIVRAKQTQSLAGRPPQASFAPSNQNFGQQQFMQPHVQQQPLQQQAAQAPTQPNLANLITSLDGPALQKLLSAMQGATPSTAQQQFAQQSPAQNITALLGGINNQGQQPTPQNFAYPQGNPQAQPSNHPQYPYGAMYQQPGAPQFPQMQPGHNPAHVQDIMAQLARYGGK